MPRFSLRTLLLSITLIACIFGVGGYAFRSIWSRVRREYAIRDMYALLSVGEMVVMHLQRNGDRWPTCWNDLQDDYVVCVNARKWSIQELQDLVEVDWSVDVEELRAMPPDDNGNAPFRILRFRDDDKVYYLSGEPNRMIHRHLRRLPPDT